MEQPELMWVEMHLQRASEPPREFARYCHVRSIARAHLWSTAQLTAGIDAICLDFDRPDIDGLQFAAATKTHCPSIPVLMLIGHQSAEIVLWALRARMFDVLVKPASAHDVLRVIERLAPILAAKRKQVSRTNMATSGVLPDEARFHLRHCEHHKLATVKDFIAKNFARDIDEAKVADMCGMSAFRFSRSFRKTYGMTFRDYVADCRVKHAQHLLNNPDIAITDIAALVGFNDPSYFARLFRKRVGVTPTDFRDSRIARPSVVSA